MEQGSILGQKMAQHEFEYREGAWEQMDSLLNAAAAPTATAKVFSLSKILKYVGVAAMIGAIAYIGISSKDEQKAVPNNAPMAAPAVTPTITEETQPKASQNEQTLITKAKKERIQDNNNTNGNTIYQVPMQTPKAYEQSNHASSANNHKKNEHPEVVDDSKVYRENKGMKNAHLHISDENSKVPAASDLHSDSPKKHI